jgi:glycosyltransferase involved in cell wall biosynthesis
MIASYLAGVNVRIYTINGLVWITRNNWTRRLLKATESLACILATDVLAVSESLRQVVIAEKICAAPRIRVLGHGASHGVDLERFNPDSVGTSRTETRTHLHIPANALVLIFVGRLVREKGIEELAEAWMNVRGEFPKMHLLICGDVEDRDPVKPEVLADLRRCSRVHFTRSAPTEIQRYYAAGDICVLPTWREGLPNVALEAAAMELPVIATRVTGCVDVVQDGLTGLLVESRDPIALAAAIRTLMQDARARHRLGKNAREFVKRYFSERDVSSLVATEYRRLLALRSETLRCQ